MVDAKEEAEISIIEVSYLPGFVKYDLQTKDGNVDVVRSYYKYENGNIQRNTTGSYQAEYWNYTEEGYLMFSEVWYSGRIIYYSYIKRRKRRTLHIASATWMRRAGAAREIISHQSVLNRMYGTVASWARTIFGG